MSGRTSFQLPKLAESGEQQLTAASTKILFDIDSDLTDWQHCTGTIPHHQQRSTRSSCSRSNSSSQSFLKGQPASAHRRTAVYQARRVVSPALTGHHQSVSFVSEFRSVLEPSSMLPKLQAGVILLGLVVHTAADPSYVYPGEGVPSDTARLIALGTGTPNVNKRQVSTSYLVQLGSNQTNYLLDAGGGSLVNLYTTQTNLSTVDKVFLTHLHTDHIDDLTGLYGLENNRPGPLQVWGPSGQVPAQGTNATIQGLIQFLGWHKAAREAVSVGYFPAGYTGNQVVAHEFDFNVTNQLVYNQNGVQVYSNPAFHYNLPGPVSLKLVWNNISIAYSGDTVPLQTFVDFAKGSNVVLHESVGPFFNFSGTDVQSQNIILNHTTQTQVGSIFSALNGPSLRLAIATHLSINDYSLVPIISAIRQTYPTGPLAIAQDLDVWDISPTAVRQRRFVPQPDNEGGIFVPRGGVSDPGAYSLLSASVQYPPFPAVTNTGLTLLPSALSQPSTNISSAAARG
ncbi:hypothetical protein WJX84_000433 [Apatococcus fuscideae]|uniref:Metallo-beta-lactamase domain-containing protein n=1 Tax=Apatococcus fuscideae TaxID=2026836 RepID=A0AAW1TAG2_9CHLO